MDVVPRRSGEQELTALIAIVLSHIRVCRRAGPLVPTGKNSSGSRSRHAERCRQSSDVCRWDDGTDRGFRSAEGG